MFSKNLTKQKQEHEQALLQGQMLKKVAVKKSSWSKPVLSKLCLGILTIISASTSSYATNQYASVQQMQYTESDERMKIDYTTASLLQDFGVDYTLTANFSKDIMSGATPVWDFASGASVHLNDWDAATDLIAVDAVGGVDSMAGFEYSNHYMEDVRQAGDIGLTWRTPEARNELTVGLSTSKEEDYRSRGLSAQYLHYLDKSKNRSLTTGVSVLDNEAEFRFSKDWRNVKYYNAQIGLTQVFSPTQVASANVYTMYETGALTNPYQTVIRVINTGTEDKPNNRLFLSPEKRPDVRKVLGMKVSGNQRLERTVYDQPITLHGASRLYQDNWGQTAMSAEGQMYVGELDEKGRLMLGSRLTKQSAASFYKSPHDTDNYFNQTDYASADERLGNMTTMTAEVGYEKRFKQNWHLITHLAYQKQDSASDLTMKWGSIGLRYDH